MVPSATKGQGNQQRVEIGLVELKQVGHVPGQHEDRASVIPQLGWNDPRHAPDSRLPCRRNLRPRDIIAMTKPEMNKEQIHSGGAAGR